MHTTHKNQNYATKYSCKLTTNTTLLAKQVWRVLEKPNDFRVGILKARYFPRVIFSLPFVDPVPRGLGPTYWKV
ncbi:hypothetical protein COP2_001064 [Malus domestica]